MEKFISYKDENGKTVNAFITDAIGVSGTTEIRVKKSSDNEYEARIGIAIMGSANMNEKEFKACEYNPFHKDFRDNYAQGFGTTEKEAIINMMKDCNEISESLWAV